MSYTFRLICKETKESIWIGQGRDEEKISVIYGGVKVDEKLKQFLNNNINKDIKFVNSDMADESIDWKEYEV